MRRKPRVRADTNATAAIDAALNKKRAPVPKKYPLTLDVESA